MTVNNSVLQQRPLMQRKHTAGCHQHRDGEDNVSRDHTAQWSGVECEKQRT